jgi:hypothetical protein
MTALAARYPSVAADLRMAGLTAQEEDRYRATLIRVELTHIVYPSADGRGARRVAAHAGSMTDGPLMMRDHRYTVLSWLIVGNRSKLTVRRL